MTFTLANITTPSGPAAAIVAGDKVMGIAAITGRPTDRDMLSVIADWAAVESQLVAANAKAGVPWTPLSAVTLLAPLTNPGAIFCAGSNYQDHAAEMAARHGRPAPPDLHTRGLRSWHFIKSTHCIAAPNARIRLHPRSQQVDWEAELAVIIGKTAFQVSESTAMDYVFGYTIANDLSARDLSRREQMPDPFKMDWTSHKNWDNSCPIGPWIVLARDIADPQSLSVALDVNGVVKQDSNTSKMIFKISELIADLSSNFTLWPGDIILTGTPAGVGAARNEFLREGDVVRIRIEQIGELVHTMV